VGASQPVGHIEKLGDAFDLLAAYSEGGFLFERAGGGVAASAPIVAGSTIEFVDAMLGGGFKVNNPQAVHECACGESFSI